MWLACVTALTALPGLPSVAATNEREVEEGQGHASRELQVAFADAGDGTDITLTTRPAQPVQIEIAIELRGACTGLKQSLGEHAVTLASSRPPRLKLALSPQLRADDYSVDAVTSTRRAWSASDRAQ